MVVRHSTFDNGGANDEMFQDVSQLVLSKMAEINKRHNQVESLGVGCSAIFAAVSGCAYIVGQTDKLKVTSSPEEHLAAVNPVSSLVAALIAVKASSAGLDHGDTIVSLELNPIVYLAAIKAAEAILGRNIDAELNPGMVEAARHWERDHGYHGGWENQNVNDVLRGGQERLH